MTHFFTVDVEEHFQVAALEPFVPRASWDTLPSRVATSTGILLDLLARAGHHGTFFVLGWVAERHPQLIRSISEAGHEVASHGWDHRRVTTLEPAEFRSQVRRSKRVLEDLTGRRVCGYRAPSYSIVPGYEWALDVLLDEGYAYDSSLFPIRRPGYGYAAGGRDPYWIERPAGRILEVPPATLRVAGLNLPAAGGAWFRLLPAALVRAALRDAARREVPATFYIHPWEVDPDQPRFEVPAPTRLRHYGGLRRTAGRLRRLLADFPFTAVAPAMGFWEGGAPVPAPTVRLAR